MNQETKFWLNCNTILRDTWKRSVWNVDWLKVGQDMLKEQVVL